MPAPAIPPSAGLPGAQTFASVRAQRFKGLSILSAAKQSLIASIKTTTAGTYDTSRVRHDNLTGKDVDALALVFANYGSAGSTEAAIPNPISIQASLEMLSPNGVTTQDQPRAPVNGPSGQSLIYDVLTLSRRAMQTTALTPFYLPAGATVFERTACTPASGTNFPRGGCQYGGTSNWGTNNGEGTDAGANKVADGGGAISQNTTIYYYSASALLGRLVDGSVATSVAILGDSIYTGTDDAGFGGPYVGGPAQRLFANVPHILLTCPGEKLADIVQPSGLTNNFYIRERLAMLATHVVDGYLRNDIEQGQTLTQIKANVLMRAKICMARGQNYGKFTVLPSPLSTDGWFTTANQTSQDATKDALRNSINAWLTDTSSSGFVAQANAQVNGAWFPGRAAVIDVCAPIECNAAGVLTQGGNLILGSQSAVEATGTATAASATSVTLSTANWTPNAFQGHGLYIASGTGAGQMKCIAYNSATVLTTNNSFSPAPDTTSVFQVYQALGMNGVHPLSTMHQLIVASPAVQAQVAAFLALP